MSTQKKTRASTGGQVGGLSKTLNTNSQPNYSTAGKLILERDYLQRLTYLIAHGTLCDNSYPLDRAIQLALRVGLTEADARALFENDVRVRACEVTGKVYFANGAAL